MVLSNAPAFSGDVAFDTNTLFVDSTDNRVGVGTASPQNKLAVAGNVTFGPGAVTTTSAYHAGMLNVIGGGTRALLRIENNSSIGSPGIIFGEGGVFTEDTVPTIKKVQGTNNLAIMTGGNVGIGTTSPNASLHIDGSLINTAKIQLLQRLVTITGGNNQLHVIQPGMQLYAGDGRSGWQNYRFASDSQWLIGLLGTDMVNGGGASDADMTISCKCDVTAFLISSTSGWNGVTMTGWNSLGTVASLMSSYTDTFEIWAKTLSAGTHSFDTYSAMYAFTI